MPVQQSQILIQTTAKTDRIDVTDAVALKIRLYSARTSIFRFWTGKMTLGTGQQIALLDFDNRPRTRRIVVQVSGETES